MPLLWMAMIVAYMQTKIEQGMRIVCFTIGNFEGVPVDLCPGSNHQYEEGYVLPDGLNV